MFFAEDRLPHVQAMILARDEKTRKKALQKLLPMQRADFAGLSNPWTATRSSSVLSIRHPRIPAQARKRDGRSRQTAPRDVKAKKEMAATYNVPVTELKKYLP